MTNEIQVGQTYKTVGGLSVSIVTAVSNQNRPFVGAITLYNTDNIPYQIVKQYTPVGKLSLASDNPDDIDLEDLPHA